MSKSRDKTKNGLGMLYSTASNKLNRMLLFKFIQEAGNDICFRCGEKIENIGEFTIEHKTSWLNSNDPLSTFFDLDNISFSHHKCNAMHGGKHSPREKDAPNGTKWCNKCKKYLDKKLFSKNRSRKSGLADYCKKCCKK